MRTSRRVFLKSCGAVGAAGWLTPAMGQATPTAVRRHHLSVTPHEPEPDPGFLEVVQQAGVADIWITGYICGTWWCGLDRMQTWRKRIEARGMGAHVINVPLGHPGFSMPKNWRGAITADGKPLTGTSLHPPATKENSEALQQIAARGVKRVFLDDDFRLAASPGSIGGCYCPEHKQAFLKRAGYAENRWAELIDVIRHGEPTPLLHAWADFNCDLLTESFRAQQKAAPDVQLGIMVMYFGSEKAGIRLTDYRDVPMRVGEYKFDDKAFGPVHGKTDELFSSLFHRRFVRPELAYSETTAYPDKQLSLKNKLAKLAVPTLSDVRNTMVMCDFPKEDWPTLAPAMKRHAAIHAKIAGHVARGPLKHFWGEASRYVSDDNPYSLFLALGIPFEVTGEPAADGFTFLSDADAKAVATLRSRGTAFIARPRPVPLEGVRFIPDRLPDLFAFKRELLSQLGRTPYVEGEAPVVCAWYPTARAVLLWNLAEQRAEFTLRCGNARRTIGINGLDVALVEEVDA
jgi:hypothetical protein